jgi:hypothetical protein
LIRALPLLFLALGLPAQAAATNTQLKGDYFTATAWQADDPCVSTWVYIWSVTTATKGKGGSSVVEQGAWYSSYDTCTGASEFYQGTDLSGLRFTKGAASASFVAEGYYSGATRTFSVDLTVGSDTTTSKGISNNRSRWSGGSMVIRSNSSYTSGSGTGTLDGLSATGATLSWGTSTSGTLTIETY